MEYHYVSGLFVAWLSIHLISVCVNVQNVSASDDCYWSGSGPICDGKCRLGEAPEPNKNEKIGCMTGKKKYCCKMGRVASLTNVTELSLPPTLQRDKETNTSVLSPPMTKDDCYWVGKSPNCEGSCLEGDYMASTSRTGNGSTCIVGKKKYCCRGSVAPLNNSTTSSSSENVSTAMTALEEKQTHVVITDGQCRWVGEPPLCLGSCKFGEYMAAKSPKGDGDQCETGQKKYCCVRRAKPTNRLTGMVNKTVRESNEQSYNDVDSISTSRPVQSPHRPTPKDLPVNATGIKHHLNVVKIKRKLVTAPIQSTSMPTGTTTETPSTPSSTPSPTTTTPPTTTASTTTTTMSIKPSVKANVAKKFLPLPDFLPVPLMFRPRPASMATVEQTTKAIALSTSLASPSPIDNQNETIVSTMAVVPSQFTNKSSESLQVV